MPKTFIPAAKFHVLTPFYQGIIRLFFTKVFNDLIKIINPQPDQTVLDVGCGPGNLIVGLKKYQPSLEIIGVDIDPRILKIAQKKLDKNNINAKLIEASATDIPLQTSFDIVVSTLMFHHLDYQQKQAMLKQVYRLLKPDRKFYLYDFAPPRNFFENILAQLWGSFEHISDGVNNKYRSLLAEAGFKNIKSKYHNLILELLVAEK